MVPTGSSLGLGDTIQDTGVLYGIDTEQYTCCMVPTLSSCIGLVSAGEAPAPALTAEGPDASFFLGPAFGPFCFWSFHFFLASSTAFLGCRLTETGLDQEALESILFLFSLDLKAMIAVVVRFTTMFTLNACLKFGDQRIGFQLSFASSASLAFSSSSTSSFARAFFSFVALAFFLRDSYPRNLFCPGRVAQKN